MINVDVTKMSVNVFSARGQKFSRRELRARASEILNREGATA
jgi:hypothetical protein